MNFYKHHLGDYAKATAHLSILEHGTYLLMLHHYYATEAPLPADVAVICRIIRATTRIEVEAVKAILDQFWTPGPHGWTNGRGAEEIERAAKQREVNIELGKRGGRPKKTDSVSDSVCEKKPISEPNRNPSHYPLANTHTDVCVRRRFAPPSVEAVDNFAKEKGLDIDAAAFVDFYTAKGWRIGNTPMKDWQAAVRNWVRRQQANGKAGNGTRPRTREQWEAWGRAHQAPAKRGESLDAYVARLQAQYEASHP
jgi:uncharacterized protein YdaU (DUF1376 family)